MQLISLKFNQKKHKKRSFLLSHLTVLFDYFLMISSKTALFS